MAKIDRISSMFAAVCRIAIKIAGAAAFCAALLWAPATIASDAITAGADALRPLKNSLESIALKEALVYDTPSSPSGAFYGLFEIIFTIDRTLQLNNPKVQIFVQKQGDVWRKIAEMAPPAKPASGSWIVSYVWNSRAASGEWTDTTPFKGNLSLKFRLVEN